MKSIVKAAAVVLTATFALAGPAQATVIFGSAPGEGGWGTVKFNHSGGDLIIDVFARYLPMTQNSFGIRDSYMSLFIDDGSSLNSFTGAHVASNDDFFGADLNGSVAAGPQGRGDSYLSLESLAAGSYLVTLSYCCNTFDAVRDVRTLSSGILYSGLFFGGDYRLDFSSTVTVTALDGVALVPAPGAALLLSVGLLGLAARRRAMGGVV